MIQSYFTLASTRLLARYLWRAHNDLATFIGLEHGLEHKIILRTESNSLNSIWPEKVLDELS